MQSLPVRVFLVGAIALIVLMLSEARTPGLTPLDPGANESVEGAENRRDPRRRLIPLHERPERPRLA